MPADKTKDEEQQKSTSGAADSATTYTVERLLVDSDALVGHPSHVVAGALHGQSKTSWTADEAKARIEKWLTTPVKEA